MACFFIIDVYIDESKGRGSYDDYIEKVKPIVEKYGGEYIARTDGECYLYFSAPKAGSGNNHKIPVKGKAGCLLFFRRV